MKKILIFAACILLSTNYAMAAVRNGGAVTRTKSDTTQRLTTAEKSPSARTAVLSARSAATDRQTSARAATQSVAGRSDTPAVSPRSATGARTPQASYTARAATPVVARAATVVETRTGAAYEQCKNAFFTCMDQFCTLKNDDYRRCSCSNRVYQLAEVRKSIQDAGEQLTVFTENLNVVGMTAAQASAMKSASEGENALTSDTSASKALLQAIMNSIRGEDSSVGGKYSALNSVNISFDTSNAFGITDAGQAVASYNGQNLYSAVYPQCRNAVKADCNDASLQRAINAYLMAIEQDCNTVETALAKKTKQTKSAIREGSAMLDLARVENRQKHNSDDIATCLANVESAILSEEVCGAGYHKCLDNGEFIDVSTGSPIAGVADFYKLGELLKFPTGVDAADQKLTRVYENRTFVQNFEKRVKKFAEPALNKCTEQADTVWAEYLDKAMLDIYYAQKSKVSEIKQGCFDFIAACYMNGDKSLTDAMAQLTGDSGVILQPNKLVLTDKLCNDYVQSCDNMFADNIIKDYLDNRTEEDKLTACRAVAKQCFDKYGGNQYENFYYPYSGLFTSGMAPDWFTLYETTKSTTTNGSDCKTNSEYPLTVTYKDSNMPRCGKYKSECARQLASIDACNKQKVIEQVFGGFDRFNDAVSQTQSSQDDAPREAVIWIISKNDSTTNEDTTKYGLLTTGTITNGNNTTQTINNKIQLRNLRPTGVASEIYNQVIDILTTQCANLQGRFVETQFIRPNIYNDANACISNFDSGIYKDLIGPYGIGNGENMCPRDYGLRVDTPSWGACLCWENGGRRSKWGKSANCVAVLPMSAGSNNKDAQCKTNSGVSIPGRNTEGIESSSNHSIDDWCQVPNRFMRNNQVLLSTGLAHENLPKAIQD